MAQSKTTGGITAKSHHSRKTAAEKAPDTALIPAEPPVNPLLSVLQQPERGEGGQPPVPSPNSETAPTVMAFTEPDPKKEWWYRPADSKVRKMVNKIIVLDAAGHDDKTIAKKLNTTPGNVSQVRYLGRKNGWIRMGDEGEEVVVDVEAELAMTIDRKVVRNISASLDGQMTNHQTHEMTIAAAKGRGIFKNGEGKAAGEGNTLPMVAIQVIMPTIGLADQNVVDVSVGGTPAYVEGEVES